MKETFRTNNFHKKNLIMLEKIKDILQEFDNQNIKVTLRQLYYQLVSRDIIPNSIKEYQKLSALLTNARYCGLIDWDAIEDRVRIPNIPIIFENIDELLNNAKNWYALDRWKEQDYYIELWTEKDALSSVITPITSKYQVSFIVNRGYTSASSIYASAQRFFEHDSKNKIVLYLGDHDPSGLDMDRDIKERLKEFGVNVEVIRIGLTYEQIKQYNPPENPAKDTDPRAKEYFDKFGSKSWEVDALRPDVLQELIEGSIISYLDLNKFQLVLKQEEDDKNKLTERIK